MVRYVGFSLGSALTATVLAARVSDDHPTVDGYTDVLWIATAICVVAAVLACFLPARSSRLPG